MISEGINVNVGAQIRSILQAKFGNESPRKMNNVSCLRLWIISRAKYKPRSDFSYIIFTYCST